MPNSNMTSELLMIGEAFKTRRKERNLKIMEVAKLSNVSHVIVAKIESGTETMNVKSLFNIANALGFEIGLNLSDTKV